MKHFYRLKHRYYNLKRRIAHRLLGSQHMPSNIRNGDWINHPGWSYGPVQVIDTNWALCAIAIKLSDKPTAGIVVWPMRSNITLAYRRQPNPKSVATP